MIAAPISVLQAGTSREDEVADAGIQMIWRVLERREQRGRRLAVGDDQEPVAEAAGQHR